MSRGSVEQFDVFVSYAHVDAPVAGPLVGALRRQGLRVWFDLADHADAGIPLFENIQRAIESGLSRSQVLLAYYSATYPKRRACQWELTAALLAAQATGEGEARVLVINPERSVDHVHPLELRSHRVVQLSSPPSTAELDATAHQVAHYLSAVGERRPLGDLRRARDPRWYGRPRLGLDSFVGRNRDLWVLHSTLRGPRDSIITNQFGRPVAAVSGIGGQGKTMLANEYALRFGASYPGGIFWLRAYSGDQDPAVSRDSQLRRIATDCGVEVQSADPTAAARAMSEVLAASPPALWVVDDLPDGLSLEAITAWLAPDESTPTLITTRSRAYDRLLRPVALDRLAVDDALELLTARRPPDGEGERAAAVAMVSALGGHALAIEIAGSWLSAGGSSYTEYLEDLMKGPDDVLELAAELGGQLPTGHEPSIVRTFARSLSALAPDSRALLTLAATLSDAPIPVRLIDTFFRIHDQASDARARVQTARALLDARRLSLVTGDPTAPTVHTLVARVVRLGDAAALDRCRSEANAAIRQMMEAGLVPSDLDESDWTCAHARALTATVQTDEELQVLELLASFEASRRNHRAAATDFANLVEASARIRGVEDPRTRSARRQMAHQIGEGGETARAISILSEMLSELRETVGDDEDETAHTELVLAEHLRETHHLADAQALLEKARSTYRQKYGERHPATIISTFNLASTLREIGDVAAALDLQSRALQDLRESEDIDDPSVLTAMRGLAVTLAESGDRESAINLLESTYSEQQRLLGDAHAETISTGTQLVAQLRASGRAADARRILDPIHQHARERLGLQHPDTLHVMDALALVALDLGDYEDAERRGLEVLDTSRTVFGDAHPRTLVRIANLAAIYTQTGRATEALALAEGHLALVREALGQSPALFGFLSNFASMLKKLDNLDGALQLQREAVNGLSELKGKEHEDTVTVTSNLAQTLFERGEYPEAKRLQEEVLQANRLGGDHPTTLKMQNNLAVTLRKLGDCLGAQAIERHVIEVQERVLGQDHPETLLSLIELAYMLADCDQWTGAQEALERALERLRPDRPDPGVINTARKLIDAVWQRDSAAMISLEWKILSAVEKRVPAGHPDLTAAQLSVISAYRLAGDLERACQIGERTLADFCNLLGPHAGPTCEAAFELVACYAALGLDEQAKGVAISNLGWLIERDPATLDRRARELRRVVAALTGNRLDRN